MLKIKSFFLKHRKKLRLATMISFITMLFTISTAAAEGDVTAGLSAFITAITGALSDFSSTTLSTVLVAALGITVALALAWFAYRWVTRKVSGALKRGRI